MTDTESTIAKEPTIDELLARSPFDDGLNADESRPQLSSEERDLKFGRALVYVCVGIFGAGSIGAFIWTAFFGH